GAGRPRGGRKGPAEPLLPSATGWRWTASPPSPSRPEDERPPCRSKTMSGRTRARRTCVRSRFTWPTAARRRSSTADSERCASKKGRPHERRRGAGSVWCVTRFVIDCDTLLGVAAGEIEVASAHQLVAPTLVRSQALSSLYEAARRGEMSA